MLVGTRGSRQNLNLIGIKLFEVKQLVFWENEGVLVIKGYLNLIVDIWMDFDNCSLFSSNQLSN